MFRLRQKLPLKLGGVLSLQVAAPAVFSSQIGCDMPASVQPESFPNQKAEAYRDPLSRAPEGEGEQNPSCWAGPQLPTAGLFSYPEFSCPQSCYLAGQGKASEDKLQVPTTPGLHLVVPAGSPSLAFSSHLRNSHLLKFTTAPFLCKLITPCHWGTHHLSMPAPPGSLGAEGTGLASDWSAW